MKLIGALALCASMVGQVGASSSGADCSIAASANPFASVDPSSMGAITDGAGGTFSLSMPSDYTPGGGDIMVTITGGAFKGVFLGFVSMADPTAYVGSWTYPAGYKTACAGATTLTHSDATGKTGPVMFTWTPPATDAGTILLKAAISEGNGMMFYTYTGSDSTMQVASMGGAPTPAPGPDPVACATAVSAASLSCVSALTAAALGNPVCDGQCLIDANAMCGVCSATDTSLTSLKSSWDIFSFGAACAGATCVGGSAPGPAPVPGAGFVVAPSALILALAALIAMLF